MSDDPSQVAMSTVSAAWAFPVTDSRLRRMLIRSWQLVVRLRVAEAEQAVAELSDTLKRQPVDVQDKYRAALDLLMAALLAIKDDTEAALERLGRSANLWQERPNEVDTALYLFAYLSRGSDASFYAHHRPVRDERTSRLHVAAQSIRLSLEAVMALRQLKLPLAKRLASDALVLVDRTTPRLVQLGALPGCLLAEALYEEGCLREAENLLRMRVLHSEVELGIEASLRSCLIQAAIAKSRAHFGLAIAILRDAIAQGQRRRWPRLVAAAQSERIAILISRGKTNEADAALTELERLVKAHVGAPAYVVEALSEHLILAQCRYTWAHAASREAVERFEDIYRKELVRNHLYTSHRLAIELAGMQHILGEPDRADSLFLDTLRSGMVSGLHQTFLDGGPLVGALLARARTSVLAGSATGYQLLPYIEQLASHWRKRTGVRVAPRARPNAMALTERELDVLALIAQGLSNKSIAQLLKISPETVKSHVRNIFAKLGATARSEAVAKAIAQSHI